MTFLSFLTNAMKRTALLLFIFILVLSACQPSEPPSEQGAAQALSDYFTYLHEGEYKKAAALYGGSYDDLAAMNPDLDPDDLQALWERGCTSNGLQCLLPETIILEEYRGGVYFFRVSFLAPDGSTFVLGPCCGATEEEMPPTSVFLYSVLVVSGRYKVVGLPVYVP